MAIRIRFNVPVDLAITVEAEDEAKAREVLRNALIAICDGFDVGDERFIGDDGRQLDVEDARVYAYEGDADEAEILDYPQAW